MQSENIDTSKIDSNLEAYDQELECIICNDLLFRPVSINCGHSFCKTCLIGVLRTKPQCPICRTPTFLQENNLKENIVLRTIIESKYPKQTARRAQLFQAANRNKTDQNQKNNDNISTNGNQENSDLPIQPLIILHQYGDTQRCLLPYTIQIILIKNDSNLLFFHSFSHDKKFICLPYEIEDQPNHISCILELITMKDNHNDNNKGYVEMMVRVHERILVKHIQYIDFDVNIIQDSTTQVNSNPNNNDSNGIILPPQTDSTLTNTNPNESINPDSNNINANTSNIKVSLAQGFYYPDHRIDFNENILAQFHELEQFFNKKLNFLLENSRATGMVVLSKIAIPPNLQNVMNFEAISAYTLMMTGLLRLEHQVKKRLFETRSLLDRITGLQGILDHFKDLWEAAMVFDIEVPGVKIFNSVHSSIGVLILLIVGLFVYSSKFIM